MLTNGNCVQPLQGLTIGAVLYVTYLWRQVSNAPLASLNPDHAAVPSSRLLDELGAQAFTSSFVAGASSMMRCCCIRCIRRSRTVDCILTDGPSCSIH